MNPILPYSKKVFHKIEELWQNQTLLVYLLAAMLMTLPLKHNIGSMTCIIFLLVCFSKAKKANFHISKVEILPILLYVLMVLSLLWTIDMRTTKSGLQKEVLVLVLPFAFCFLPNLNQALKHRVFTMYSYVMAIFALFYMAKAIVKFSSSGDASVFFYHALVKASLNAIYASVFASFGMFFFLAQKRKTVYSWLGFFILALFVFLLSSKNVIVCDFILVNVYFFFFSGFSKKIKASIVLAIFIVTTIFVSSIKPVRDRFMIEFQTALIDSSLKEGSEVTKNSIYSISLKQAWSQDDFQENDFFPGAAFRVYQTRIFLEMLQDEGIFLTGFGLDAAQTKIKDKVKEHHLHHSYGVYNFHNEYVQLFSELGFFGFFILVSMLFISIRNGIRNKDFVHIAFSVTMIVLFLTESFLSRQRGIIFFIVLYCLLNKVNHNKDHNFYYEKNFNHWSRRIFRITSLRPFYQRRLFCYCNGQSYYRRFKKY